MKTGLTTEAKRNARRKKTGWGMWWGPTQFTSRGASIAEVLISVTIVIISALAAASFFASQAGSARNVRSRAACQAALDSQLSYFRQLPSSDALNWTQPPGGTAIVPIATNQTWLANSVLTSTVAGKNVTPTVGGAIQFQTNYLQQGSMGALGAVMHNVPGACTSAGVDISTKIPHNSVTNTGASSLDMNFPVPVNTDLLPGFAANISVQPYDLATGNLSGGGKCAMWARPQGIMDAAPGKPVTMAPNTDSSIGYRVKLQGTYTTPNGPATCSASEDFSYPIDRKLPKTSVVLNVYDAAVDANSISPYEAMQPPGQRPQCTHFTGKPASVNLQIGFSASTATTIGKIEPGTVFLCRDVSKQMNANYCPGAAGAQMNGQNYTGIGAPWVPCGQVTACGIPPYSSKFVQNTSTGDQKYLLNYRSPGPGVTSPDGLWGCDVQVDVATVDPAGNFQTLSTTTDNPVYAGFSRMVGKYFQPAPCYACYKKKSSLFGNLLAIVAIAYSFGLIGLALACGMGGGICKPPHSKFIGNYCKNIYPGGGKNFCTQVAPNYPTWFGKAKQCNAITGTYPGHPTMTYSIAAAKQGDVGEDSSLDKTNGILCEASAICNNGTWMGLPQDDGTTGAIGSCGKIYTGSQISIAGLPPGSKPPMTGTKNCITMIPDSSAAKISITPASYYQTFNVCDGFTTGLGYNALCSISFKKGKKRIAYPVDAKTSAPNNTNPNNYFYFNYQTPVDTTLPECS